MMLVLFSLTIRTMRSCHTRSGLAASLDAGSEPFPDRGEQPQGRVRISIEWSQKVNIASIFTCQLRLELVPSWVPGRIDAVQVIPVTTTLFEMFKHSPLD